MSRLKTLTLGTKLTLAGAVIGILAVAFIATGVDQSRTETPRRVSIPVEFPAQKYVFVGDLCEEIDWSLPEDEFGQVNDVEKFESRPSENLGSRSTCAYSFGEESDQSPGADIELAVSVEQNTRDAIYGADVLTKSQSLAPQPDRGFSQHWRTFGAKGSTEQRSEEGSRDLWVQDFTLIVQYRNLMIEMTAQLRSHSKPDTNTVVDDAMTMQIADALTSQISEIHDAN